jgi:Na+-transporting methylmalonyl-CoA/oxaloacetate decarboxylase gamma subunit
MKKKLVLLLCVLSCLILATGCSLTRENKNLKESTLKKTAQTRVEEWFNTDYQAIVDQVEQQGGIEIYKEQYSRTDYENLKATFNEYKSFTKMKEKYGAFKKIEKKDYSLASSSASVSIRVLTDKNKRIVFTASYDKYGTETDFKVEEYQSIGSIMGRAGLNTVMSMAIVFAVLIAISLLISCFKFIGAAQNKQAQQESTAVAAPVAAPVVVEENLADDLELVAVITAAIAAAGENESADGLVVRSIVRRS